MELGLGTVQFGMDYGVANKSGRTPEDEVRRILTLAKDSRVRILDTAAAYGDSEVVLGRCLPQRTSFRVVTKTMPLHEARGTADALHLVRDGFARSLDQLGLPSVYGLLAHHADDLLGPRGDILWAELDNFRRQRLTTKIGLSVYTGAQVDAVLERFDIDLIQIPVNILDQRLISGGQLARLASKNVEVHVRSIFLQGLLLMEPDSTPAYFAPVKSILVALRRFLAKRGLTPAQGALAFARSLPADVILLGVNNMAQLAQNVADFAAALQVLDFSAFAVADEKIVNPALWRIAA